MLDKCSIFRHLSTLLCPFCIVQLKCGFRSSAKKEQGKLTSLRITIDGKFSVGNQGQREIKFCILKSEQV